MLREVVDPVLKVMGSLVSSLLAEFGSLLFPDGSLLGKESRGFCEVALGDLEADAETTEESLTHSEEQVEPLDGIADSLEGSCGCFADTDASEFTEGDIPVIGSASDELPIGTDLILRKRHCFWIVTTLCCQGKKGQRVKMG